MPTENPDIRVKTQTERRGAARTAAILMPCIFCSLDSRRVNGQLPFRNISCEETADGEP